MSSQIGTPEQLGSTHGRAMYLGSRAGAVLGSMHTPAAGSATGLGVVVCPPFGWDEICTHRSLRAWAEALAVAGHPTLRIDLPGTGDSAGSLRDANVVGRWSAAVADSAAWLAEAHGCTRVVALGVGLGGIVALRAVADGAAIDDLVLWGVPSRGSLFLRELRAFVTMAMAETVVADGFEAAPPTEGEFEAAGFTLGAEALAELDRLDLTELPIPWPEGRRALLLGRDSLPPDRALRAHLEACGVDVSVGSGDGYGAMLTHPQFAKRPEEVIASTVAWVGEGESDRRPHGMHAHSASVASTADHTELDGDEGSVIERPFDFDFRGQRLSGILTEPAGVPRADAPLCVVLLNAGAIRRIGPNRMWVEAARRWASGGVPTLRLDVLGLGDSDGDERPYVRSIEFHRPTFPEQVSAALDELVAAGLPERFVVGGLCSGAYWAYHAAIQDSRIRGVMLINLSMFLWTDAVSATRSRRRARELLMSGSWSEIARIAMGRGKVGRIEGMRAAITSVRPPRDTVRDEPVRTAFEALSARRVDTLLLFSGDEPLHRELIDGGWVERAHEWPSLSIDEIPINDHTFRPGWAQRYVHERLDRALRRSVDRVREAERLSA